MWPLRLLPDTEVDCLDSGLLISYYGDDFTGSTDVMESLTFAGLRTVLFLDPPTRAQVAELGEVRGIGVAGRTRAMPPNEAEQELRPVWEAFRLLDTPIVHYKTCSTFDSSPEIGSIGRAVDVGVDVFEPSYVPLIVGAPILRRYCAFGNVFASSGLDSEMFRLDRHPTMSCHPTTPMNEADIRVHLSRQTDRQIGLVDVCELDQAEAKVDTLIEQGCEVVLFDTVSDTDLVKVGQAIWAKRKSGPFVAGSSGVEYALVAYWEQTGDVLPPPMLTADPVEQIVVVSGSCSPVTADQIDAAEVEGFGLFPLDTAGFVDDRRDRVVERAILDVCALVSKGKSVIAHTGLGPDDPRIAETMVALEQQGLTGEAARMATAERIGRGLGHLLREVLEETGLRRAATTGGDTSYYVAKEMGVTALEAVAPMAPGSPLCRVFAPGSDLDGCEVTFKGGQVGKLDFFKTVLFGR